MTLTRKYKPIAKWAEDKDKLERILLLQTIEMDGDAIFGGHPIEGLKLIGDINYVKRRKNRVESSANWKNEFWTP